MKINKTFRDEEIVIGDVFHFDFRKIMDTPFRGSNFAKSLEEKGADEVYIQVAINPEVLLNVPSYKIYYLKDKEIIHSTVQSDPIFFSYVLTKEKEGVLNRVSNHLDIDLSVKELTSHHYQQNAADTNITDKHLNIKTINDAYINYGDILKIDYKKLQEIQNSDKKILNSEFFKSFEAEKTDDLYFHIVNMSKTHNHCFSFPEIYVYAFSDKQLKNGETNEQNAKDQKRFEETNDERRKPKTYIKAFVGGLNVLSEFSKQGLFQKIVDNNPKFELDANDIKPKNQRKLKI